MAPSLINILAHRPNLGMGLKVSRSIWSHYGEGQCYYIVRQARMKELEDSSMVLKSGKTWGNLVWCGTYVPLMHNIDSWAKKDWFVVEDTKAVDPVVYGTEQKLSHYMKTGEKLPEVHEESMQEWLQRRRDTPVPKKMQLSPRQRMKYMRKFPRGASIKKGRILTQEEKQAV
eukprot:Clim_evm61s134 gene=Clim_evmTU61s134